jgi:diguanylate cyclase (GGDEF)-like protein
MRHMSIVTRILGLIVLTLALVAGGEVFNGLTLRRERLNELKKDTVELARIAQLDMVRILDGTQQLLATLAKLPAEHGWDERACSIVRATANSDFEYDHVAALDPSGTILCSSSGPGRAGLTTLDPDLVERVVRTAGFSVGSFGRGGISGNEVLRVGYPVVNDAGAVVGVVYAGINLMWLNTALSQWKLGEDATINITDRHGIVIARHPDSNYIGRPLPDSLKPFVTAQAEGAVEAVGFGGVARLYGYIPITAGPSDSLAVLVGRDHGRAVADISRSILLNAAGVLVGLLLSAGLSFIYASRFLARPFQKLLTAAGRWREGDWTARVDAASGIPEFDRLATAFDLMATEVSARQAQITRMARHDGLTGLVNRSVFVEALDTMIATSGRTGGSFAVLYLDLDHFKDINDTLGHPVGDELLRLLADRLRAAVRETDIVARFGGDEFALIVTDVREPGDAGVLADKLLTVLAQPFSIRGAEVRTGASIGIAVHGQDSAEAEMLLSHADLALYRAKAEGRGTYRFFTEAMDAEVRARVRLMGELREAIVSGQLFLLYQPQIEIDSGRIVGVEALVRWRHPTRGIISPGQFVPAAESSGLIVALGHWVLREACRQMAEWLEAGCAPPLVAVNVSALQFKTPRKLEQDLVAILAETGVPPRKVELELTESVLMDASREHGDLLLRLRDLGVRLAIDDFGTGYSSLDYLRRFPVDRVKIAQQFMCDPDEPSGGAIVKAAISLAQVLKLDVVVEGVETAEQLRLVAAWGGRTIQGFYFSKPVGADAMTELLRKGRVFSLRPVPVLEAVA